jgi:NTP pyrophosphatase (non-canonical NTP hydrolase)
MALITLRTHALKLVPKSLFSSQLVSKFFFPSTSRAIMTTSVGQTAKDAEKPTNDANPTKSDQAAAATLISLAERALELAQKIQSHGIQSPTFHNDTLADLPTEIDRVRFELVDVSGDLLALARGAGGAFGRIQTVACTHVSSISSPDDYRF